ncbi:hypothetical protein BC833DRAFT_648595 [Globomyces pollinis-pini]|nr:hypothetical protein BC833DRAFT_648595 [Globomyces pollinis-pini]
MPRYEPLPSNANTANTAPEPPRYQPLNVENPNPPSAPLRHTTRQRSPFNCTCFFDVLDPCIRNANNIIPDKKKVAGYLSGFLFGIAWWIFIDGAVFNAVKSSNPDSKMNTLAVEDWIPGILSTLALFVVNLIDRESLSADDSAYESGNVAMKARACAFSGIAIAFGSIGGALAIFSLKYVIPGYEGDALYLGQAIAAQSILIFASSMVLWFGKNSTDGQISL